MLAIGLLLLAFRVQYFISSPWNALVPVLAFVALVTVAAAVATGRLTLLPLMAGFATFVSQSHVGYVPIVGATVVAAIAWAYAGHAHDRRALA